MPLCLAATLRRLTPSALRFCALTLFVLAAPSCASAATYFVSPSGSDGNPGTFSAQFQTVQKAINVSANGDTVLTADGTNTGPGDVDLDFGGRNGTVASENGAYSTFIDCGGSANANHRGIYLHCGETNAVIRGQTIENGYEYGNGGGIYNTGLGLPIQNRVLKNNTAVYGGGLYNYNNDGGTARLIGCAFSGNTVLTDQGGGIFNENYAAGPFSSAAGPLSSTTGLTSSLNPSTVGQAVTFTATVTGTGVTPTGTITFTLYGTAQRPVTLTSGGTATLTISSFPAGPHDVSAAYNGDAVNAPSTSPTLTQTVNKVVTATSLASSLNPSLYGQSVTFTATVSGSSPTSPSPTGSVTFTDAATSTALGTAALSGGTATLTTSGLAGGTRSVTATYNGDAVNAPSTSPALAQTVSPVATATALFFGLFPSVYGQSYNLSVYGQTVYLGASVNGTNPTGTVTFTDGSTTLGTAALSGGTALLATSALAVGSHPITATYGGDAGNSPSTSPATTQTVRPHVSPQYVSPSGSDANFGPAASPKLTIQAAINATLDGDTVIVEDGTYTGPGDVDLDFGGRNGLTVTSQNGAVSTIIDCGGSGSSDGSGDHRGFLFQSGEAGASVSGLTIKNGYVTGNYSNPDGMGAGVCNKASTVTLTDCIISGNTARGLGGGLYNGRYDTTTVVRCVLTGNVATSEGGGAFNGGALSMTGCTLSGNVADYGGGGFHNDYFGTSSLINCTLTGNSATYGGGGAVTYNSAASLTNCTLTANTARGFGSGFYNNSGTLELRNDVLYDASDEIEAQGTTSAAYSDVQGGLPASVADGGGNVSADPLFVSPADLHLQAGSPCLGAGTPNGAPTTTIDGYTRPNPPSIGAYELDPRAVTTTTLTSSLNPSAVGQSVTFTATVTGSSPTGTVTFTVNGAAQTPTALSGGTAALSTSALAVGPHTVTAAYGGDASNTAGTSAPLTQMVSQVATMTALTSSLNPSAPGQSVTFTATVTGSSPTGTVTFSDGGTTLGTGTLSAGTATLTTSALTVGSHTITAAYGGDTNNAPSTSPTLTQAVLTATAVTLPNVTGAAGQTVTLSATLKTVAGAALSGKTLTFSVDGTAVGTGTTSAAGIATKTYVVPATLTSGGHALTAAFAGDTNDAASTGTGTLTVTPTGTTLTLAAVTGIPGTTTTFKATLKHTTGGAVVAGANVTFTVDGASVGTAVTTSAGLASLSYVIPAGDAPGSSHPTGAAFAGSGSLSASSGTSTLTVSKFTTTLSLSSATGTPGQTVTLSATLKSGTTPLSGRTVSFTVDGTAVGTGTTNAAGLATLPYAIPTGTTAGSHALAATFVGDAFYLAATGKGTVTVKSATSLSVASVSGQHGTSVTLSATLTAGGAASSGKTVTFTVDGKSVGTAVTDATGTASLPYTIPPGDKLGSHAIGASFVGDGGDTPSSGKGTLTVG